MAMKIAEVASQRSEDPFRKVGACVLDKSGRVLGVGYNGLKSKHKEPNNFWEDRENRRKYVIHAEVNALSEVDRDKADVLAVTLLPCSSCARFIASYNLSKVLYKEDYEHDQEAINILKFHNINLIKYSNEF